VILMGFFSLAIKGLWCAAAYISIVFFMSLMFPQNLLTEYALQPIGMLTIIILFMLEIVFDFYTLKK